jgi:hypothetical protein
MVQLVYYALIQYSACFFCCFKVFDLWNYQQGGSQNNKSKISEQNNTNDYSLITSVVKRTVRIWYALSLSCGKCSDSSNNKHLLSYRFLHLFG